MGVLVKQVLTLEPSYRVSHVVMGKVLLIICYGGPLL